MALYNDGMAKNPHAVALGKLGGSKTSDAKRSAAKLNGKKGGKPTHKRLLAAKTI